VKLLVGLGNPGPRYAATRHNAGFRIAERFAAGLGIRLGEERFGGRYGEGFLDGLEVAVLLPGTFMNDSGRALGAACAGLALDPCRDLLVALDDLDLPFGRLRLRASGGAGGHRGLGDVLEALATREVARLRFGIGRPPPGRDPVDYVLEPFSPDEERALADLVAAAAGAVELAFAQGIEEAMASVNRAPAAES
jgi:PTH1 family peptidyl-tRNA hydrolase